MACSQHNKRRASSSRERDIISNLPGNAKEKILSFLPIKEAVRTSILSNTWRYTWASIPELTIKDDDYVSQTRHIFYHFVDMLLFSHIGPIHKFNLCTKQCSSTPLDRWILYLSRNGIRELILNLGSNREYKIPSSFFSCHALNYVYLRNCSVKLPRGFDGFKLLRTLELEKFALSGHVIEKLVSSCPLLEKLLLREFKECIILNICAPNLRILEISGKFVDLRIEASKLIKIDVELQVVPVGNHCRKSYLAQALGDIPDIERLEMHKYFVPYLANGPLLERFPIKLNHLKVICLDINLRDTKESTFALSLFQNAPCIQELDLSINLHDGSASFPSFWELRDKQDCLFEHLQTVKIHYFVATEPVLAFVKFILCSAPRLLKLILSEENLEQKEHNPFVFKKLLQLPRASVKAEIIFA